VVKMKKERVKKRIFISEREFGNDFKDSFWDCTREREREIH